MWMRHKEKKETWFNEFFVLGSFVAVVTAGLAYVGIMALVWEPSAPPAPAVPQFQMSVEEYRTEARDILTPFLGQVRDADPEAVMDGAAMLAELAAKTQERLIRMRVPGEAKDAHLTLVLLLDAWKLAADVVAAYPWLK